MTNNDKPEGNDGILAAYQALQGKDEGDRKKVAKEIRAELEEVVRKVSEGKRIPIHSPDYAEIARELGFDELREVLDKKHREITRRTIEDRLSEKKRKKRQTEEHLRQYILPRLEQGILGEILTNPRTEIDTPTGWLDIFADDESNMEILVELKGEDWKGSKPVKHYELTGQVTIYFNELKEHAGKGRAIIVVPEFPQRVYNGLREYIQAGKIKAFTFTFDGEDYNFSPVDFVPFEEQLITASKHAFKQRSPWTASTEREAVQEEDTVPDSIEISKLIPKRRPRKRRKRKYKAVPKVPQDEPETQEAAAAELSEEEDFGQYLEKWEGIDVTPFVHFALKDFYADEDELIKLANYYITALGALKSLSEEIEIERCDRFLTRIMRENSYLFGVDEWYESFDSFLWKNATELREYRETFKETVNGVLPLVRDFLDHPGDVSKGTNLVDRINGIIRRYKKAPRSIKIFASVFEKATEHLLQKMKTSGLSDEENLILEDIVTWNLGQSEFNHLLSIYSFKNTVLRTEFLWQVNPEIAARYAKSMKESAEDASLGGKHLEGLVYYNRIISKMHVAEPTEELKKMEDRFKDTLSRTNYIAGVCRTFREFLEEWEGAEVDKDTYKRLKRLGRNDRVKSLVKANEEYETTLNISHATPWLLTVANFAETIIPGLPRNHPAARQLTRKHSPLLDSQECAKQDADYLENINRSSQEFITALERFWEQLDNESSIACLENALRGITDVCYKGCPVRRHLVTALDSSILEIERREVLGEQKQLFLDTARIVRHEQDETMRKLNLETAWTVLGRYRLLLHIHKKLAVNYIKNQAELLDISTRMDMEALERGEEFYGRILSKIKVKEESPPTKMPAYRPPEPLRSQPKSLPEPSLNPSAYADDVYSAIIRTKREDMFPEAIQVSALDLAYHITDSEALTARQKLELKGQLTHFKGKDPLNKLMYDRMPDEEQFDEFARQMKEAVDKGTVPDVHEIYSQTIK